jgi:hypothetical protein
MFAERDAAPRRNQRIEAGSKERVLVIGPEGSGKDARRWKTVALDGASVGVGRIEADVSDGMPTAGVGATDTDSSHVAPDRLLEPELDRDRLAALPRARSG